MKINGTQFELRLANESDFEAVVALVNSAYRGEVSRVGWTTEADYLDGQRTDVVSLRNELQQTSKKLMLLCQNDLTEKRQEVVGTAMLESFSDEKGAAVYLGMLTVKPLLQNSGLGRQLMDKVETHVRSSGVFRVTLGVLNPREELMAWYERRGYQRTGKTERFPYGDQAFGIPKQDGLHFIMFEKSLRI